MLTKSTAKYLVIGSGRTGRHMIHYLNSLNLPCQTWDRSQSYDNLKKLAQDSTHILLAISDREIETFAKTHLLEFFADKKLIHFSGALVIPEMIDAHPLMTFTQELYDLATYQSISFITSSQEKEILPGFPNRFFKIKPEEKPLYHALCVASGNFTTLLWQKLRSGFQKMDIPFEAAHPYLLQITKNLISDPEKALTGPIARKDLMTVQAHDQAFQEDAFQEIYRAFLSNYYPESLSHLSSPKAQV